ncbi:hypothetical protein Rhopal_006704-T1 [Rhodotorula paludigena]|uniref:Selenoprotein O n=1 Tax=Rhodotorula paludigena TaxID=86838 RepID=A0AAV5GVZ3_9BASI|nr:hypothetical protein Rhopal_006704-T1 [Rhodotorula paludigena]
MDSESAAAYQRHFSHLISIMTAAALDSFAILERLLSVFDYSAAQMLGFEKAFASWFATATFESPSRLSEVLQSELTDPETARAAEAAQGVALTGPAFTSVYAQLDESTAALVRGLAHQLPAMTYEERYQVGEQLARCSRRGCRRHYDANVFRIAKSKAIPEGDASRFKRAALKLATLTSPVEAEAQADEIRSNWPQLDWWLRWWSSERIAGMAYASQLSMGPVDLAKVPETTNAVEAHHKRVLQLAGDGDKYSFDVGIGQDTHEFGCGKTGKDNCFPAQLVYGHNGFLHSPDGQILTPVWQSNSCWLDAFLAIAPAWLRSPVNPDLPIDLASLFSGDSLSEAYWPIIHGLAAYLQYSHDGGVQQPVDAAQAKLTLMRNDLRRAMEDAEVLRESRRSKRNRFEDGFKSCSGMHSANEQLVPSPLRLLASSATLASS